MEIKEEKIEPHYERTPEHMDNDLRMSILYENKELEKTIKELKILVISLVACCLAMSVYIFLN